MTQQPGTSVEQPLWHALTAYRVLTLGYALILFAMGHADQSRAWVGVCYLAVLTVWTLATVRKVSSARRCTPRFLAGDLTLGVTGILLSPVADPGDAVNPTLPTIWVAGAVIGFAIKFGWRWAALASGAIGVANLVARGGVEASTVHNVLLVCVASIAIGYVVEVARASERTLSRALRIEAATRERQRLARDIHDSVLQVLALVQRRGGALGGEAAELGRLAGEQERALRRLVSGAALPEPDGTTQPAPDGATQPAESAAVTGTDGSAVPNQAPSPAGSGGTAEPAGSDRLAGPGGSAGAAVPESPANGDSSAEAAPLAESASPSEDAPPDETAAVPKGAPPSETAEPLVTHPGTPPAAEPAPRTPSTKKPARRLTDEPPGRRILARLRQRTDDEVAESPQLDLRALLAAHAGEHVTFSGPISALPLPAADARQLDAAVAAALDNVRHHATGPDGTPGKAWILLEDEPDEVIISVRDDGPGIPEGRLAEAEAEGRLGASLSIRGRLSELGGTAEWLSVEGQGTEVELKVPRA